MGVGHGRVHFLLKVMDEKLSRLIAQETGQARLFRQREIFSTEDFRIDEVKNQRLYNRRPEFFDQVGCQGRVAGTHFVEKAHVGMETVGFDESEYVVE